MKTSIKNLKELHNLNFTALGLKIFQIFVPVLVLMVPIIITIYYSNVTTGESSLYEKEKNSIELQKQQINSIFSSVTSHLLFLANNRNLDKFYLNKGALNPSALTYVIDEFLRFSSTSLQYDQIRFIDAQGMEIIRVSLQENSPYLVEDEELQNKVNRYYFKNTMHLKNGEIYISPLDLNIENDAIEKPYKPIIRLATPIYNQTGDKLGIVVLNYLAKNFLDVFKKIGETNPGQDMLLNSNGYWIESPDTAINWGFMFESKKDMTIKTIYPEEWKKIYEAEDGQFTTENGLFTFTTVYPFKMNPRYNKILATSIHNSEPFWKIVSFLPNQEITSHYFTTMKHLIPFILLLFVVLSVGSWFLYQSGTQKQQKDIQLQKLSLAIEQSPVTVVITDTDGNIEYANRNFTRQTGYELEEVLGKNPRFLKSGHMSKGFYKNLWETISTGTTWKGEFYNKSKDGEYFWESTSISPIRNEHDQITHYVAVKEDITVRKQIEQDLKKINDVLEEKVRHRTSQLTKAKETLEQEIDQHKKTEALLNQKKEELERSNKELEEFAYIASHDLQEPLRKINSFTKLLQKRYQDKLDEEADKYMSFIEDAVERMKKLISDLLNFSRVSTKEKEFCEVNCNYVMAQALNNLELSIKETNAKVNYKNLPTLTGDETQINQLFQNLVSNALKYRNEETIKIDIVVKKQDDFWQFAFKDNGIGFDPKFKEKIFIIFQRLHSRAQYSGTGIGLAVCKKIVERHGGKIWAESEKGKGATFYFTLPV